LRFRNICQVFQIGKRSNVTNEQIYLPSASHIHEGKLAILMKGDKSWSSRFFRSTYSYV